jgi:hypothetical protein
MSSTIPLDVYLEEREENRKLMQQLCELNVKYRHVVDKLESITKQVNLILADVPNAPTIHDTITISS